MEHQQIDVTCSELAKQKREFFSEIREIFDPLIESVKRQKNFHWEAVRSFYNAHRDELNCIWRLRIFCSFVLKLLHMFDSDDGLFIKKMVYVYYEVLNKYNMFAVCTNCKSLNNPIHYLFEEIEECKSILHMAIDIPQDISAFRELYSNFTVGAVFEGDYVFLQVLVKYGLSYFLYNASQELVNEVHQLKKFLDRVIRLGNDVQLTEASDFLSAVLKRFATDLDPENCSNFRKILLIFKYVKICFLKRQGYNYPGYIKCLNLYLLTVPETVVSVKDVEDFLHLIFAQDGNFITQMYSNFKELFPESPSLSSPRSLKHLCRCEVRDCIRNPWNPSFPAIVSKMRIPSELKSYLLIVES